MNPASGGVNDVWLKLAWLVFMLADVSRLFFRPKDRYTPLRIVLQSSLQNIGYVISLAIIFWRSPQPILGGLLAGYVILQSARTFFQLRRGTPYSISNIEEVINDLVIKPYRLAIVLVVAWRLDQAIWALGFGIVASKWLLNLFLDKVFLPPRWYHITLVALSALLSLLLFFQDIGVVSPDTLKQFLNTAAQTYATFIGLLAVFLGLFFPANNSKLQKAREHYTRGVVLLFSCVALLVGLCMIGILIFGSTPLDLSSSSLFRTEHIPGQTFSHYLLFGTIAALAWFLWLFAIEVAYLMLLHGHA